ncbi:Na/Pi cotransporter family protein [Hydrogenophaga aquatica]
MLEIVFPFVGGLGLFLIGMMMLSDGLVAFGGDVMKQALARFTGTPSKAILSGTLATMVVQSSSATTVTLIGFVSAGLITFTQAIGVVIGASLGNTATGWIVAGLGLKVNLGFYTLPLIGAGALLKLLVKGRWGALGVAAAGFGMMFLGLNTLQEGMRGVASVFSLAALPDGGYAARWITMLIGLALTAVLQSSTAAIATTLTALHTETINFDQAAALVVGAAIGTTVTGALAAIGGTIHAQRTALAYVLFNLTAGLVAIALLPLFFVVIGWLGVYGGLDAGATSLAAFHTLFIAVGVMLFLPFVQPFAQAVERLLPEREAVATQRLDRSMLAIPSVALEASQRALEHVALRLLDVYGEMLAGVSTDTHETRLAQAVRDLDDAYAYVSRIEMPGGDGAMTGQRIAQLHAIDHLLRLRSRLKDIQEAGIDLTETCYHWALDNSFHILELARQGLRGRTLGGALAEIELDAVTLASLSRQVRHELLEESVSGPQSAASALRRTDTFRWLERTANHIWRICHYLSLGRQEDMPAADVPSVHTQGDV